MNNALDVRTRLFRAARNNPKVETDRGPTDPRGLSQLKTQRCAAGSLQYGALNSPAAKPRPGQWQPDFQPRQTTRSKVSMGSHTSTATLPEASGRNKRP